LKILDGVILTISLYAKDRLRLMEATAQAHEA